MEQKQENHMETSKAIENVNQKIMQLEEKFIANQLSYAVYNSWCEKFTNEKQTLEANITKELRNQSEYNNIAAKLMTRRFNLYDLYQKNTVDQKHILVNNLFKDSLIWHEGIFLASFFNPFLQHNLVPILKKGLLNLDVNTDKLTISSSPKKYEKSKKNN